MNLRMFWILILIIWKIQCPLIRIPKDNTWTVPAEEAVREHNVGPTTHCIIKDRIRSDDMSFKRIEHAW
ncbi:unnamed protein product [Lactuca virosa]|uniref:Uncharacterized protein n=1 Tax=Lactuca virosa TaxID=75947 RepID=A0AAU9MPW9_9ASTR|nr:unnamed protein product [Lactuca virosa]